MSIWKENEKIVTFKCPNCGKTQKESESISSVVCSQCCTLMHKIN